MGFENVKVDGLSVEKLEKEIEIYNDKYFGKISFGMDNSPKGQYELYKDAEEKFLNEQTTLFKSFFRKLGWDETGNAMRANEIIYIKFEPKKQCLEFHNGKMKKVYSVKAGSDFKENPHFCIDTNSHGWKRYTNIGGKPTRANDIKKQLDEIKEIVDYNDKLNRKYNFRLVVDKDAFNTQRYISEIKEDVYNDIIQLLEEISEKEF